MIFNYQSFKTTFKLYIPYLSVYRDSKIRCLLSLLFIVFDIGLATLIPYLSKHIIETLSISLLNSLGFTVLLLGVFWSLEKMSSHFQEIIFFPVINRCIRDLTGNVVQRVHQSPLSQYQHLSMPEILSCLRRVSNSARAFFKICILMVVPTSVKIIITLFISATLGISGFAMLPILLFLLMSLYKGTQWYLVAREKAWQASDQVFMRINDSLINTKIVRPFHDVERQEIQALLEKEATLWYKSNTRLHLVHIFIALGLGLALVICLLNTLSAIQASRLSIADFVLIQGQLMAAFLPLKTLSIEFRQLAEATLDIDKVANLLALSKEQDPGLRQASSLKFNLNIQQLGFSYHNSLRLFNDLNLTVYEGDNIALLGNNGSGKSTLCSLMAGLQIPTQGQIFINDHPIKEYCKESLRTLIHYIPQDFRLFNLSVYENLTYGLKHISAQELECALQAFDLHPLIQKMPQGLHSSLGEMGIRLSGGEKQRIALARSFLIAPKLLILDETLHSLKIEDEGHLLKILSQRIPTLLLVSHRPSILPLMNRHLKIENHTLIEIDIPKEARNNTDPFLTLKEHERAEIHA